MFGFLNTNKPSGISSYDVIRRLKRQLPKGEKVGHAGTLDPFATGVLVVALGHACRLLGHVQAKPKEYRAVVRLGATSDTDDSTGKVFALPDCQPSSKADIERAVGSFVGTIQQVPPAHSAILVQGQRAYDLAREGKAPELKARPVVVHAIEVVSYAWPNLELHITCGSGTYIRSIARDLGQSLGVGGYCDKLTRTRVGSFTLEEAKTAEDVRVKEDLISPLVAVADLPKFVVNEAQIKAVSYGQRLKADPMPAQSGPVVIVDENGNLLAMAEVDAEKKVLRPTNVFVARG